MRRLSGFFALMLVLGVASFFIVKAYLPPKKEVKNMLPQGPGTPSVFSIPRGFSIDVYADLKKGRPRALTFDDYGNLLVSIPNQSSIVAVLDTDKNGRSDAQVSVLTGLNKPHGIVVHGGYLFVAQTDKVSRFVYDPKTNTAINEEVMFSLPGGGRHSTRTIKIYDNKLFVSVGSSCDTCVEKNEQRASILVSNLDGTDLKVFASGLRNTVFFTFDGQGRMWGSDMGRDSLGDHLPPDEINIITEGGNYGWPYCYGNAVVDSKFNSESSAFCSSSIPSAFNLPAHSAPLGIVRMGDGFLVALHGSWNSSIPVGYKIVKLNTFAGQVVGMEDYVSGFIDGDNILGRPVDLVFDSNDNLYISDDHTGLIYILSK
ncbi:PQQ-dependent sugar dehydrogenase [Candidatus Microgenomates bacterium]|nr:PQQ-dependent sugar dehydrogenase [Candidatus Microgenomates bacterium]